MHQRPSRRERRNRIVAIGIILALIMSLLVGALSVAPVPPAAASPSAGAAALASTNLRAGAQGNPAAANSVQVLTADPKVVDTDGDGIENNEDSDVDGDGILNGEDPDIDGDGIENFDDADPIDTTDVDSNAPEKPIRPVGAVDEFVQSTAWIWVSISLLAASVISGWLLAKRRKK